MRFSMNCSVVKNVDPWANAGLGWSRAKAPLPEVQMAFDASTFNLLTER